MGSVDRGGFVLAGALAVFSPTALAQAPPSTENRIHVEVVGLRNETGQVLCALFSSAEGFPNKPEKALVRTRSVITSRRAVCEFSAVTAGTYAVSVFHDENSNGRLDRNFIGLPREGVGASNDAKGRFGPPKFEAAAFIFLGGSLEVRIAVRYL
jgi:uncharacterized protein (DUF2141 family)